MALLLAFMRLQSLSLDESESLLDDGSDESSLLCLRRFFLFSGFFLFFDVCENVVYG